MTENSRNCYYNDVSLSKYGRLLRSYFTLEVILGRFVDCKKLLEMLAKEVFCIDDTLTVSRLYACVSNDNVVSIRTKSEHETAMRAITYSQVYGGIPIVLSKDVAFAVSCKGEVLEVVEKLRSEVAGCSDIGEVVRILEKRASGNSTSAMFILGFAYCNLLGDRRDGEKGLAHLKKSSRWNYIEATLALMCYADEDLRQESLPIFKAQIEGLYDEDELYRFIDKYAHGRAVCADSVARLVREYIENAEKEAETTFNPRIAAVLNSSFISEHDKRRCVKQGADELLATVYEYALTSVKARENAEVRFEDFVSESRAGEAKYVESNICRFVAKLLNKLPLLVCSDDFILDCYTEALSAKFDGVEVITLDLTKFDRMAFAPVKGNAIVSRLVNINASSAIFILKNADKIDLETATELSKMLDAMKNKSFLLQDAGVSVDLSGNTFILVAKTDNLPFGFLSKCHPFTVEKANDDERFEYVCKVLPEWCAPYVGGLKVNVAKEAAQILAAKDAEIAQSMVERICFKISGVDSYTISVEDVKASEDLVSTIGGLGFRVR